jgi:hypothetical protein
MLVGNKSGGVRKVGVWDRLEVHGNQSIDGELQIGKWTIFENKDGHLVFKKEDGDPTKPDTGYVRFAQDGNIWANRSTQQGWVADNLGNKISKNDTVWLKNEKQGGYIGWTDWGQNGGCLNINGYKCDLPKIGGSRGDWEKFVIEKN